MSDRENALEALDGLNPKRADDRDTWIKTGMILRAVSSDLLDAWIAWSKRSSKFEPGECERLWEGFASDGGLGLGTLRMWADEDRSAGLTGALVSPGNVGPFAELAERFRAALSDTMLSLLTAQLGVSRQALRRLGVGYDPDRGCFTFPERSAAGRVIGIGCRHAKSGVKWCVQGGKRGLTMAWPLDTEAGSNPDHPILIVEGPSDAAAGMDLGFAAIGRPTAAGGAEHLKPLVRGRHVVIVGENDRKSSDDWPGKKGAETVGYALDGRTASTRIIFPPDGIKDLRVWKPLDREALLRIIASAELHYPDTERIVGTMAKPIVLVPGDHQDRSKRRHEISTDRFTAEVLNKLPEDQFYRKGQIVGHLAGEPGRRRFQRQTPEAMRIHIDRHLRLTRMVTSKSESGERCVVPEFMPCYQDPARLVLAVAGSHPGVRQLKAIASFPIFSADWTLLSSGYHDGLYYDPPSELADLTPERDPEVIRSVLLDLVIDFPFLSDADRQNFFGLLWTPIIRWAIGGNVPMHTIMAPLERTGKTKLAEEVFGGIILGGELPTMQLPAHEEEVEKRVLAMLLDDHTLVNLDNIRTVIDSPALASVLTARTFTGRVLGVSKTVTLPNHLVLVATGNNVAASGEIAKRSIPIYLQPGDDRPEERRDFHHPDLSAYIRSVRRRVLECLVGAVLNWLDAGRPTHGAKPLGGFEDWSAAVGGILGLLGFDQWRTNERQWRRTADPEGEDLQALVLAWWGTFKGQAVAPKALADLAHGNALYADLFVGKSPHGGRIAFSKKVLRAGENRPVGDLIIRRVTSGNNPSYFLEPSAAGAEGEAGDFGENGDS